MQIYSQDAKESHACIDMKLINYAGDRHTHTASTSDEQEVVWNIIFTSQSALLIITLSSQLNFKSHGWIFFKAY